jgi:hypothetical protein
VRSIIAYYILIAGVALSAAPDSGMPDADRAFSQAEARADRAALEKLLDAGFTFTGSDGRTLAKAEFLRHPPSVADTSTAKAYIYDQIGDVQAARARLHTLRVWVKRPDGWKIIVYQEVMSLDAAPSLTPGLGAACENPCKSIPYQPKSLAEQEVVAAYSRLETAAMAHNSAVFSTLVADEFIAASSASNKLYSKRSRIYDFDHAKFDQAGAGGLAPSPLVSAEMFDFPDAILMRSEHRTVRGTPLHVTRIWIKRDGRWMETLSYQTAVQSAR